MYLYFINCYKLRVSLLRFRELRVDFLCFVMVFYCLIEYSIFFEYEDD